MNIFGIGLPEMAVIFTIALLVFGPKKLPEIGRSMGKALRGFQDASRDFESEFTREAKQLEQAVAIRKPETEKIAAATPKEDSTDS
ncbi:TatA/E family twin arginine-targeting protein translocase [Microcoleus sp. herbarium19]|uniref:TatA/E family twin arginine-targeting protein translocase n=1 Tax=unclassified Microcoleus TaxID=2642155 RepID=UPI002FD1C475